MALFFTTFFIIALVVVLMAVGVMFGRKAIKGSCGGPDGADCLCTKKCDKRKKIEAMAQQQS